MRVIAAMLCAVATASVAQDRPAPPPPPLDAAAPVTLEDAGERPAEVVLPRERDDADAGPGAAPPRPIASGEPLPPKVRPPDEAPPEVTIRAAGEYVVEEYRRNGRVWMVRYVPKEGVPYTFIDSDGDGRLEGDPREGRIQPVYFTIYEWE